MAAAARMTLISYRRKVQGKAQGGEKSSETRWPAKRRAAPNAGTTVPAAGKLEKYVTLAVALELLKQMAGVGGGGGTGSVGGGGGEDEGDADCDDVGEKTVQAPACPSTLSDGQHSPDSDG